MCVCDWHVSFMPEAAPVVRGRVDDENQYGPNVVLAADARLDSGALHVECRRWIEDPVNGLTGRFVLMHYNSRGRPRYAFTDLNSAFAFKMRWG